MLAGIVALGASALLAALFFGRLLEPPPTAPPFWLAPGLAAATLASLRRSPRFAMAGALFLLIAGLGARIGHPPTVLLALAGAGTLTPLLFAELLRGDDDRPILFDRIGDTVRLFLAALGSVAAGATLEALNWWSLSRPQGFRGLISEPAPFQDLLLRLATQDLLSILLVVPVVFAWREEPSPYRALFDRREAEKGLLFAVVLVWATFVLGGPWSVLHVPAPVWPIAFLLWTALRLSIRTTSAMGLVVGTVLLTASHNGSGPFSTRFWGSPDSIFPLQLYLALGLLAVLAVSAVLQDRNRIELALEESERRLALALAAAGHGVWELDVETDEVRWDDTWRELLGVATGGGPSSHDEWLERVHPGDRPRVETALDRHLRSDSPDYEVEYRFRTAAGGWRWLLDRGRVVEHDLRGRPRRVTGTMQEIHDRKIAELLLESEKELSDSLISSLPGVAFVADPDGRLLRWNRHLESITGTSRETIRSLDGLTFVDRRHRRRAESAFEAARSQGESSFECDLVGEGGECRPFLLSVRPIEIESASCVVVSGIDLTPLRRAEDRERRSREQLVDIARQIPGIVFQAVGRPGRLPRITFVGEGIRNLLGIDPDSVTGESFDYSQWLVPGEAERVSRVLEEASRTGSPLEIETTVQLSDGSERWVRVEATPRTAQAGNVVWNAVAFDITQHRAGEQLTSRLAAILEATTDLVATTDDNGKILYMNRAGRRLLRLPLEGETGLRIEDLYSPELGAAVVKEGMPAARRRGVWSAETSLVAQNGEEIPVLQILLAHKSRKGSVDYYSTIAKDIRQRVDLERQLLQAQKMEALGQLAAGIAHDFNNLLTPILGYVELFGSTLEEDDPRNQDVDRIREAAEAAARLTRKLLALGRRQIMEFHHLDLAAEVDGFAEILRRSVREDIAIEFDLGAIVLPIRGDPAQIQQILMNLVINARDAMSEGGRITISTSERLLRTETAQRKGLSRGRFAVLAVADTGHGMDEGTRGRVFEPFFTTKEKGHGTGLGLSTVYGIVRQHRGEIHVESEPQRGTRFEIYFPVVEEHDPEPKRIVKGSLSVSGNGERILLAEDDPEVRKLASRVLRQAGYHVQTAVDGAEALELAAASPPFDLVLSDVVMPGLTGPRLVDRLRERQPDLPAILMTGYSVPGSLDRTKARVLLKPFKPTELLDVVSRVLREKRRGLTPPD